jgi:DNA-binding response OmpR family regulator
MKNKVLVFFVNAPASVREMLSRVLRLENYEPLWATNEQESLEFSRNQQPDLLLLDFNRPLKRVMNRLEQLQAASGFVPVILITENKTGLERTEAGRVAALIRKPFEVSLLLRTMSEVLHPVLKPAQPEAREQHSHAPSQ